jgi:putative ABC transport system substrate-binding protein
MSIHIRRREFIATLSSVAIAQSLAAHAQPAMPVIGFVNGASSEGYALYAAAFRQGLQQAGYIEGQNAAIEYRWAEGRYERLPALLADLIRLQPTVIAATSTPAAVAAKAAATTIPIVFTTSSDPVQLGLVPALSRPGGNITGVTQLNVEVAPKRLELAHELAPAASTIALLLNPTDPNTETLSNELAIAAATLGLKLHIVRASTEREIDAAFASLAQLRAGALVIGTDAYFNSRTEQLGALALRYAIPTIYQYRQFCAAGGLISYGGNLTESYRLAGIYAGRIVKGEKPADLPVQQVTRIELIVNLKTAKALGIEMPPALLIRADEVIE